MWQHKDKDGNLTMGGMAEALEAAGVPLPDPAKPVGKMNNRKMTFDRICRDKWVEICEAHGYVIEHEPDPKHKSHLSKAEFIELQERTAELDAREKDNYETVSRFYSARKPLWRPLQGPQTKPWLNTGPSLKRRQRAL